MKYDTNARTGLLFRASTGAALSVYTTFTAAFKKVTYSDTRDHDEADRPTYWACHSALDLAQLESLWNLQEFIDAALDGRSVRQSVMKYKRLFEHVALRAGLPKLPENVDSYLDAARGDAACGQRGYGVEYAAECLADLLIERAETDTTAEKAQAAA